MSPKFTSFQALCLLSLFKVLLALLEGLSSLLRDSCQQVPLPMYSCLGLLSKRKKAHLDDQCVASKQGRRQRVEHIVERVVPRHNRPHNAQRVILHAS